MAQLRWSSATVRAVSVWVLMSLMMVACGTRTETKPSTESSTPTTVGAFGGISNIEGQRAAQLGARFSPCRLAFGVLSPDLVATNDAVGLGISLYPPSRAVGSTWAHFGLGAWYMAPWDGGRPGTVFGVSTSFNH